MRNPFNYYLAKLGENRDYQWLAEQVGVSYYTVKNWAVYGDYTTSDKMKKAAAALRCRVRDLWPLANVDIDWEKEQKWVLEQMEPLHYKHDSKRYDELTEQLLAINIKIAIRNSARKAVTE